MWKGRVDYFQTPHAGRPPSHEAIKRATHLYVLADYNRNGSKYSTEDQIRVHNLLMDYRRELQ